jgi:hypothetical protein
VGTWSHEPFGHDTASDREESDDFESWESSIKALQSAVGA